MNGLESGASEVVKNVAPFQVIYNLSQIHEFVHVLQDVLKHLTPFKKNAQVPHTSSERSS